MSEVRPMVSRSARFLLAFILAASVAAFAHPKHRSSAGATDCDENHVYFDDEGYPEQAFAREEHMIPAGSFTRLDVESFRKNGVALVGWPEPGAKLVVCKFAAGATKAEAEQLLRELKAEISDGKISGTGPSNNLAAMQFILFVPANVTASARSTNGPVEVSGASGTFDLETRNGPIDLARVNGTVTANAENGPIAVRESSGDVNLRTRNGPISVSLDKGEWQGK